MSNSVFNLSITTNQSGQAVKDKFILARASPAQILQSVANWINAAVNGSQNVSIIFSMNAVQASGTITFSSFVQDETITVNGTLLTGKDSPSGSAQFKTGAGTTDTTIAAAAAACINANTTLNKQVVASSSGTTMTVTSIAAGPFGNLGTLAISAHGSVSGANLASGASDVPITVAHGL